MRTLQTTQIIIYCPLTLGDRLSPANLVYVIHAQMNDDEYCYSFPVSPAFPEQFNIVQLTTATSF